MDSKTISVKEFRELGLLQEVNRQWGHPRGLAFSAEPVDPMFPDGPWQLGIIWDAREDPEGVFFVQSDEMDTEKMRARARYANELFQDHLEIRTKLGCTSDGIQHHVLPLEDYTARLNEIQEK